MYTATRQQRQTAEAAGPAVPRRSCVVVVDEGRSAWCEGVVCPSSSFPKRRLVPLVLLVLTAILLLLLLLPPLRLLFFFSRVPAMPPWPGREDPVVRVGARGQCSSKTDVGYTACPLLTPDGRTSETERVSKRQHGRHVGKATLWSGCCLDAVVARWPDRLGPCTPLCVRACVRAQSSCSL